MSLQTRRGEPPSLAERATYAALLVPMQIARAPLLSTIPALYAMYGSISLRQIGFAMMLLRLVDVCIDPLIGLMSDRTHSPWGRRKPWLLARALVVLPASWALFAIPRDAGIAYFMCGLGFAYIGWSMVEIPHTAWLGELSHDDVGRAALSGWRTAAASAGAILLLAIPLLPRFADAAMTPAVLAIARLMPSASTQKPRTMPKPWLGSISPCLYCRSYCVWRGSPWPFVFRSRNGARRAAPSPEPSKACSAASTAVRPGGSA